ncbi:MAG TPA: class I SAM-dependent methyltransferase [Verrucomicrobiales bacterium]|nr:class I SAM-dependent methyltransferase [Verrucomicrobiales bacterium]
MTPLHAKSTIEEIRTRFDGEVERFSDLNTGQEAAMDSVAVLDVIARAAAARLAPGARVLDLGCGAGNYTLRILRELGSIDPILVDLSRPMLDRARARLAEAGVPRVTTIQADLRELAMEQGSLDAIVSGAVLHHLREDADWEHVFSRLHLWLRPGGLLLVADLVVCDDPALNRVMWDRYGEYLVRRGGEAYRDAVFGYIDHEDTPRSFPYQLDLLKRVGFRFCDVLHRNSLFGCYAAIK